jgi:hypothetical protein
MGINTININVSIPEEYDIHCYIAQNWYIYQIHHYIRKSLPIMSTIINDQPYYRITI